MIPQLPQTRNIDEAREYFITGLAPGMRIHAPTLHMRLNCKKTDVQTILWELSEAEIISYVDKQTWRVQS